MPPFDFYDAARPVYTHPRFLPATKVERCTVDDALDLRGLRPVGRRDRALGDRHPQPHRAAARSIRDSLVLGADYYETLEEIERAPAQRPAARRHRRRLASSQHAIVDKNARIGRGVRIVNEAGERENGRRRATTSATGS